MDMKFIMYQNMYLINTIIYVFLFQVFRLLLTFPGGIYLKKTKWHQPLWWISKNKSMERIKEYVSLSYFF